MGWSGSWMQGLRAAKGVHRLRVPLQGTIQGSAPFKGFQNRVSFQGSHEVQGSMVLEFKGALRIGIGILERARF